MPFLLLLILCVCLQAHHARGEVVKVRPSRLCVTNSGKLVRCDSRGRQAEFEDKLYSSPEELLSKPLSMASDLYSLVSPHSLLHHHENSIRTCRNTMTDCQPLSSCFVSDH